MIELRRFVLLLALLASLISTCEGVAGIDCVSGGEVDSMASIPLHSACSVCGPGSALLLVKSCIFGYERLGGHGLQLCICVGAAAAVP